MSDAAIDKQRDLLALGELAKKFREASLSEATRRAYQSDWAGFVSFCSFQGATALPASSAVICAYLAELAELGRSVATIVRALTSVNKAHELSGHSPIRTPDVLATLRGIQRTCGRPQTKAVSIRYSDILRMAAACDCTMIGTRDRALLLLGWCSALRRSELVALDIGDLVFSDRGIILTICRSKTDQEGHGQKIAIPRSDGLCPVAATSQWIERLRPDDRTPDKPLFRSTGNGARGKWITDVRGRLSARMVSRIVKFYGALIGLPADQISSHSLRRGLATEAGARSIPERIIARHTRHLSTAVLREYIDAGNIWDENPLLSIYPPSSAPSPSGE